MSDSPSTLQSVLAGLPPQLRAAGVYWSKRKAPPRATFPLTIATQLPLAKAEDLKPLCRSWPGPLSAAVLLPLVRGGSVKPDPRDKSGLGLSKDELARVAEGAAKAAALHKAMEEDGPCQLDLLLVYELYASAKLVALAYPVNVMRNLARLQARTPLIASLEPDLMLGGGLASNLAHRPEAAADLLLRVLGPAATMAQGLAAAGAGRDAPPRTAVVLPALSTHWADNDQGLDEHRQLADSLVRPGVSKAQLQQFAQHGTLKMHDPFGDTQKATDTNRWLTTKRWYDVEYRKRYEPWVILDRRGAPWYDAKFRGYALIARLVHVLQLNASEYTFAVHPRAFLMHRPHKAEPKPKGGKAAKPDPDAAALQERTLALARTAMAALGAGNYTPLLDRASEGCRRSLPWWT
ncbi:hypothetical protein HYH03_002461 [Edaphochlamys debaryana]|uniref:Uncharacterized protein n=1 Tax=Edaphochlamys debaryana TaxID=47281 RepID=A0A835YD44_9CHLO|nr:hypothetical protein HYH03_002461 [Edaphochlamys debaryana]|eukprot:KAG2499514.1 hypothetical protein HYH03_002461 [Edaphochlamys debaryana]